MILLRLLYAKESLRTMDFIIIFAKWNP